jgi:hypothetical protein
MAFFLWDEFQVHVTTCSIGRALKREGWSKNAAKYKARQQNAELRDTLLSCPVKAMHSLATGRDAKHWRPKSAHTLMRLRAFAQRLREGRQVQRNTLDYKTALEVPVGHFCMALGTPVCSSCSRRAWSP